MRRLAVTARSISESDLTQRFSVQGSGELVELTETFNEMMNRLQGAFISQRNFINDAGHELRTPITIIQGHLELLENVPSEVAETLAIVSDELDRMNQLVNDMLKIYILKSKCWQIVTGGFNVKSRGKWSEIPNV